MTSQKVDDIEQLVPGVAAAFQQLRNQDTGSISTSNGAFYNHTLFGRDASMSAKFVTDIYPETAWCTIKALAGQQGTIVNRKTNEAIGRIHHELRDFRAWHGSLYNRLGMSVIAGLWGEKDRRLRTYFAADTTADYIRLAHKYVQNVDNTALHKVVQTTPDVEVTLRESVRLATEWLVAQVDQRGLFIVNRHNRWSLPYQTFADSVTAYHFRDGKVANSARAHSFVEVQAYAMDAIEDALRLFGDHAPEVWHQTVARMRQALLEYFWDERYHNFAPALFVRGSGLHKLDVGMITSGWTLNTSFWYSLDDSLHQKYLTGIIEGLFQEDFLTAVGIRTKSSLTHEPLGRAIDYHGSRTVWPMFNFMVIEGLRRHGFYRLAEQLEVRLLNGVNALGQFPEFLIAEHDGTIFRPTRTAKLARAGQMIPEQNIAFTIVPSLVIAERHLRYEEQKPHGEWQHKLEERILHAIPQQTLLAPQAAKQQIRPTPLKIRRTLCGLRSMLHVAPVILSKYE